MSDEFNKGYFSTGAQHTYEAKMGRWARLEEERRAEEAARRQSEREGQEHLEKQLKYAASLTRPAPGSASYGPSAVAAAGSGGAPSLAGCVKGCAVLGALLMVAYAVFGLNIVADSVLFAWGVKGALWGAAGGVAVYVALVVLGLAMKVLGVLIKFAFYAALVVGLLYLFS
ncbi:hypothetical protein p2A261 (plasmid) [Aromatoleum aromaticum EbN1]|uniref:Transmembrane protein n=1 Tax=Aromatoleum aromaticum (strain DSM 19018 / LMG 30748 / EbN1) TaxID=76114 RepID=Q5NWA9_AROAE|nr:hypothetical protein [Aromatoleum aromaticum]CAI10655.1 hypothetical protein p2A261 [Aromatoleum aromaticum EbN1]